MQKEMGPGDGPEVRALWHGNRIRAKAPEIVGVGGVMHKSAGHKGGNSGFVRQRPAHTLMRRLRSVNRPLPLAFVSRVF